MTTSEPWTIGRLLTWTTDYLKSNGSSSPRLDAEVLLAHARGCQRIDLYAAYEAPASDELRTAFRELVRRRAEAVPVAYLVGRKEFYSLSFEVTPDVLIPRPETEFLVVSLLDKAKELSADHHPLRIADIGTGSGILAVCAAKHLPTAQVTAIDTSPAALDVARKNAQAHGVAERIDFQEGDLLSTTPSEPTFDFILSNPPYIGEGEFAALDRDVREHEPRGALVAGPNGTEVIQRLIPQAGERLKPGGWLMIEISPLIADTVKALLPDDGQFDSPSVVKDFQQHPRVALARRLRDAM